MSLKDRALDKISPEPNSGCWLWTASLDSKGYGQIGSSHNGKAKNHRAHRVVYEIFKEPIPDGFSLDHLCRVKSCVNPDHLEPVPHKVNCRRGEGGKHNKDKTHCSKGHKYEGDNIIWYQGRRYCRECNRFYSRRRQRERRAKLKAAAKS